MCTTNIHLLQFKIQSHLENMNFECRYIRIHTEEKASEISNITFATLPFPILNTAIASWILWSLLLLIKHQMRLLMVTSNIERQNLEFVNLKWVTYAQPIPLPLSHQSRVSICDMIKGNESDVGNIDFEL